MYLFAVLISDNKTNNKLKIKFNLCPLIDNKISIRFWVAFAPLAAEGKNKFVFPPMLLDLLNWSTAKNTVWMESI